MSFPRGPNFVSKPRGKKSIPKNIVGMDLDRIKKYYDRKGTYFYKQNFVENISYKSLCFQLIKVLIN